MRIKYFVRSNKTFINYYYNERSIVLKSTLFKIQGLYQEGMCRDYEEDTCAFQQKLNKHVRYRVTQQKPCKAQAKRKIVIRVSSENQGGRNHLEFRHVIPNCKPRFLLLWKRYTKLRITFVPRDTQFSKVYKRIKTSIESSEF